MSDYKERFNQGKLAAVRKRRDRQFPVITREDIDKALDEYLAQGGKIKRVEPEWIEEGEIYIYR